MELSQRSCVKRDGGNFPQLCEACRHPSPLIEVMPELRLLTRSYHCYSSQDGFVCSWFLGSAPPNISCIPRLLRMEAHFTDSPISIHDELGAWPLCSVSPPVCILWSQHLLLNGIPITMRLNRRQFQPIWAFMVILLWQNICEIWAKCYLG